MSLKIIIISDKIGSGKTSALFKLSKRKNNCGGFLTPTLNGKRKFLFLHSNEYANFEADENENNFIEIGRFRFKKEIFNLAKAHLKNFREFEFQNFFIDEIGPLELSGKGFEPELSNFLSQVKKDHGSIKNLFVVIRDSLLEEALNKYEITNSKIINATDIKYL